MLNRLTAAVVTTAFFSAQLAFAGGMEQPPEEPQVEPPMVEEPGSMGSMGSGGWLVPLLLIGVIAYVVSQDDDDASASASDLRLKTDVERVGTTVHGLPLYTFKYIWSDVTYQGVMAQDVEAVMPEAVISGLFGVKLVDYEMLGIDMQVLG
jgi:hypothetical protein